MAKNQLTWMITGAVIAILLIWFFSAYNGFVKKEENIKGQWAQVETQYQRRADLIPNLVNTVKGYAQFESGLLQNITALRSQWTNAKTDSEKISAASSLDSALSRLLVVYENYPELKTISAVSSLMDELSGTENRISVERKRYNDFVKEYNVAIKTFPNNIFAGITGFKQKTYFESSLGAADVPKVNIY